MSVDAMTLFVISINVAVIFVVLALNEEEKRKQNQVLVNKSVVVAPKNDMANDDTLSCLQDETHNQCYDSLTKCTHFWRSNKNNWSWYLTVCDNGEVIK